jgi:hypothetical protein
LQNQSCEIIFFITFGCDLFQVHLGQNAPNGEENQDGDFKRVHFIVWLPFADFFLATIDLNATFLCDSIFLMKTSLHVLNDVALQFASWPKKS